jgi:protein TonB
VDASTECEAPRYPTASRLAGESGTVRLLFLISTQGEVEQSRIEKTSGFDRLDDAARDALSLCHFKPGTVDGRPERSWARLDYVWRLK